MVPTQANFPIDFTYKMSSRFSQNLYSGAISKLRFGDSTTNPFRTKGVGRNFSRGGLSEAPGEGSPAIFQFPEGGGSTPIFGHFNGQNEIIVGPGGHGPPCLCLPTPLGEIIQLRLFTMKCEIWEIFTTFSSSSSSVFALQNRQ